MVLIRAPPPKCDNQSICLGEHLSTGGSDGEAWLMGSGRVCGGCVGDERSVGGGAIQVLAG